ncbi:MAG: HD domain-containing protein [Thermoguttaceae bacterium]|nr:HD domain-containing protein [Thermoguttaceae bacterium]
MPTSGKRIQDKFRSETLVQDSIHGYISIPSPESDRAPDETAFERDLIDSPWLQRLRQIHQLQTAWLVYPTAEHSRFQHVLGVAQLASRVWSLWSESFYRALDENAAEYSGSDRPIPSQNCLEELLRVAGLLHDVGHGPFGHFFDDKFLSRFKTRNGERLTHETLGGEIICSRLNDLISGLRRSPSGEFAPGERLDPEDVAFLITRPKPTVVDQTRPRWLRLLRDLFSGLYTIDNMDFVLRDAYASGFDMQPFDLERLLHYTFFTSKGLTIHQKGLPTLQRFLTARADLFRSIYFHRTVRAIDVELADLFKECADLLYPHGNPVDSLDEYLRFTDWSLLSDVASWDRADDPRKRALAESWRDFINRKINWRLIAEKTVYYHEQDGEETSIFASPELFEAALRAKLPEELRALPLRFDIARCAFRPTGSSLRNFLYRPETDDVVSLMKDDGISQSVKSFRICRVYGRTRDGREAIVSAFNSLTGGIVDDATNV